MRRMRSKREVLYAAWRASCCVKCITKQVLTYVYEFQSKAKAGGLRAETELSVDLLEGLSHLLIKFAIAGRLRDSTAFVSYLARLRGQLTNPYLCALHSTGPQLFHPDMKSIYIDMYHTRGSWLFHLQICTMIQRFTIKRSRYHRLDY